MTIDIAQEELMQLWKESMPEGMPIDEFEISRWVVRYDYDDIIYSIKRSGEKMNQNLRKGLLITESDPLRYACSVLKARTEWRKVRYPNTKITGEVGLTKNCGEKDA